MMTFRSELNAKVTAGTINRYRHPGFHEDDAGRKPGNPHGMGTSSYARDGEGPQDGHFMGAHPGRLVLPIVIPPSGPLNIGTGLPSSPGEDLLPLFSHAE